MVNVQDRIVSVVKVRVVRVRFRVRVRLVRVRFGVRVRVRVNLESFILKKNLRV
jgi:hypothetical protein